MQPKHKASAQNETRLDSDAVKQIGVILDGMKPTQRDAVLRACLALNSIYLPVDYESKPS